MVEETYDLSKRIVEIAGFYIKVRRKALGVKCYRFTLHDLRLTICWYFEFCGRGNNGAEKEQG